MKLFLTKIIIQSLDLWCNSTWKLHFFNELLPYFLLPYNLDRFEIKIYYFLHQNGDKIAFIMQQYGVEQLKNFAWICNNFLWLSFSSKLNNNEFFIGSNSKLHSPCVWHKFEIWWENRWSKTKRNNGNERKWEINWKYRFFSEVLALKLELFLVLLKLNGNKLWHAAKQRNDSRVGRLAYDID